MSENPRLAVGHKKALKDSGEPKSMKIIFRKSKKIKILYKFCRQLCCFQIDDSPKTKVFPSHSCKNISVAQMDHVSEKTRIFEKNSRLKNRSKVATQI